MDISEQELVRFQRDGFLIMERVISDAQVERTLAAMNRVYAGIYSRDIRPAAVRKPITPFGTGSSVHWVLNTRTVDGDLWNLATDPQLGVSAQVNTSRQTTAFRRTLDSWVIWKGLDYPRSGAVESVVLRLRDQRALQ